MKLEDLRGTHDGDEIALIGSGDNLILHELGNPSFGCNLISRCYKDTPWRPWYYICVDKFALDHPELEDDIRRGIADAMYAFIPHTELEKFGGDNVIPLIVNRTPFDGDITEGIYGFGTTLMLALQIARYIGFEKATFINCDLYFGRKAHFYDHDPMALHPENLSRRRVKSILAHAWMIDYAKRNGMKVSYR